MKNNFKISQNIIIPRFHLHPKILSWLWLFSETMGFHPVWFIGEGNTVFQARFPLLTINQLSIPEISPNSSPAALNESLLRKGSVAHFTNGIND